MDRKERPEERFGPDIMPDQEAAVTAEVMAASASWFRKAEMLRRLSAAAGSKPDGIISSGPSEYTPTH